MAGATGTAAATFFKNFIEIQSRGLERRGQAKNQTCQEGESNRKGEDAGIDSQRLKKRKRSELVRRQH